MKAIYTTMIAFGAALFTSSALAQTKITLGYTTTAENTAAFVAKEEGYFRKHGLDVDLKLMTLNSTIPPGLLSDSIQIGTATPTVLLQAVDSGMDLVAIANGSVSDNQSKNPAILVRVDSGIKTAQDLTGKKVGVPGLGAVLHVLTRSWLTEKGVDYSKVIFIETPFPQMDDILKGGAVSAVITADPIKSLIERSAAAKVLAYPNQDFPNGYATLVYTATREWASKNAVAVKAFHDALADGIAFADANPARTRADIGKYIKLPPPVLEMLPVPKLTVDLDASRLRFWKESMRQQGMLKTDVNLAAVVVR